MGSSRTLASLSSLTLSGLISIGAHAKEENPTMMQVQTGKAIALCRAINAKTGSVYNCDNGRLTIEQRGNNMIISRETVDNTGRVLVLPLVNQYAVKPNGKATFTWLQNDLDMILKKK